MKTILIDAPGSVHRFYHAIPPLSTSTGIPTNAVYGFTRMLLTALNEQKPDRIAACFDFNGRLGRLAIDSEYKANRQESDGQSSVHVQMDLCKQVCSALGVTLAESYGWEADDVIATLAKANSAAGDEVEIVTSDKDFQQLVAPNVSIWDPAKKVHIKVNDVVNKLGIMPDQIVDYMALVGDKIDNVPNIPLIGPKTAVKLITKFGSIDSMLQRANEIDGIVNSTVAQSIRLNAARINKNRALVSFKSDIDLPALQVWDPGNCSRKSIDDLFSALEFSRRLQPLVDILGIT